MKTTAPITYRYDLDGAVLDLTRRHTRTAYPRNGNVGNPTEYFVWEARLDGELVTICAPSRTVAYETARAQARGVPYRHDTTPGRPAVNVRAFSVVQEEMRSNYRGRLLNADAA